MDLIASAEMIDLLLFFMGSLCGNYNLELCKTINGGRIIVELADLYIVVELLQFVD